MPHYEKLANFAGGNIVVVSDNEGLASQILSVLPDFSCDAVPCGHRLNSLATDALYVVDALQHPFRNESIVFPTVVLSAETDPSRLAAWMATGVVDVLPPSLLLTPMELRQRLHWVWLKSRPSGPTSLQTVPQTATGWQLAELFSGLHRQDDITHTLFSKLKAWNVMAGCLYAVENKTLEMLGQFGHVPEDLPFMQSVPVGSPTLVAVAALRGGPQSRPFAAQGETMTRYEVALPCLLADQVIGVVYALFDQTPSQRVMSDAMQLAGVVAGPLVCARKLAAAEKEKADGQRLLAMASHDLRNLLHVVSLSLQIAERQKQIDSGLLNRTRKNLEQALSIVDTLMDYTRVELGDGIPIAPEPVQLDSVMGAVVENAHLFSPGRQFSLKHLGDLRGIWDPARLTQIFSNLIFNAHKYAADDHPIHVTLDGRRDPLYITIANPGLPIPDEAIHRLFEPMVRATQDNRDKDGLGLGLYIVDHLVKAHGGRIWVQSDAESGTVFTVELPRSSDVDTVDRGNLISRTSEVSIESPSMNTNETSRTLQSPNEVHDASCRALYKLWLTLVQDGCLPHLARIPRDRVSGFLQDMAFVRIEKNTAEMSFEFLEVGGALEQRLGRTLTGVKFSQSQTGGELSEFLAGYARAFHARAPDFSYLVFRFPAAPPARFERLVLPFSSRRDGMVTEVISIARFSNFPVEDPFHEITGG